MRIGKNHTVGEQLARVQHPRRIPPALARLCRVRNTQEHAGTCRNPPGRFYRFLSPWLGQPFISEMPYLPAQNVCRRARAGLLCVQLAQLGCGLSFGTSLDAIDAVPAEIWSENGVASGQNFA